MKHLLLNLIIGLFAFTAVSQNNSVLIMSKKTGAILNGDTHVIVGDGARPEVKEEFYAVMGSQDSMLVAIKRQEITIIPNTSDFFCWYLCYAPVDAGTLPAWYAEDSLWMYKDDTISNFSVYFNPKLNKSDAQYQYVFYPADNPTDSSFLDVVFNIATVGITKNENIKMGIFPNPANNMIQFKLSEDFNDGTAQLKIFDMSGKLVQDQRLQSNQQILKIDDRITSGSYLVKVVKGGQAHYEEVMQIRR